MTINEGYKNFFGSFYGFYTYPNIFAISIKSVSATTSKFNFDDTYIPTPPAKLEVLAFTKSYPVMLILMSGLFFSRVSVMQIISGKTVNCEIRLTRSSKFFCKDRMFICKKKSSLEFNLGIKDGVS